MTTSRAERIRQTSETFVTTGQKIFFGATLLGVIVMAIFWPLLLQAIAWVTIIFFGVFVGLKMILWHTSMKYDFPKYDLPNIDDPTLPIYTIFVPLFKEVTMLPRMLEGLSNLKYPKDKLQILLLVEDREVDEAMHEAIALHNAKIWELSARVIEIPNLEPRGKQKALNIGLSHAEGEFAVIYDAEDIPERDQLLKAIGRFRSADSKLGCVQARLFFENETDTWVSRILWMEYIIHFEWILKGFAQLNLIPPLGGTSNHFPVRVLQDVALDNSQLPRGAEGIGAWDPWNVTEDADLAGALSQHGYRIEMIDSVTNEIATTTVKALIPQRSRWLKGYIQTGLVYTRDIPANIRLFGPVRWCVYVLFLFGTPLSILLSTLSWILTITYFVTRSEAIERLFPWPLLYAGTFLLVFGNFALFIQHIVASHRREGYTSVKWVQMLPIWQQLATVSLLIALWEVLQKSKRFTWHKTAHEHGFDDATIPRSETEVSSFENADTVVIPIVRAAPVYQGQRTLENDAT